MLEIRQELVGKAKSGTLSPAEYNSGTFTISNMGMFGVTEFGSLLPVGQGGILAVGATQDAVVPDNQAVLDPECDTTPPEASFSIREGMCREGVCLTSITVTTSEPTTNSAAPTQANGSSQTESCPIELSQAQRTQQRKA